MRLREHIIVYWLILYGYEYRGCMWLWLNLSPLYNVTSRNVSSLSFSSYVNLMVLWIWLILVMYMVNSDVEPVHMMKISSMNHFHSNMFGLPSSFNFSSNLPINRFAYAGAIFVPIAVPWICK